MIWLARELGQRPERKCSPLAFAPANAKLLKTARICVKLATRPCRHGIIVIALILMEQVQKVQKGAVEITPKIQSFKIFLTRVACEPHYLKF
jgi:hypothetical protein